MKKSRFTEEQIASALKQAETGTRIDEICRKMGISDATFYKWRQKYGGLGPSELRKLACFKRWVFVGTDMLTVTLQQIREISATKLQLPKWVLQS